MPEGKRRRLELNAAILAVGEIGPFQFLLFFALFLVGAFHGARITSGYYFLYEQEHKCRIPPSANRSSYQSQVNLPWATKNSPTWSDKCYLYTNGSSHAVQGQYESWGDNSSTRKTSCPDGWVYDTSVMEWTAIRQFDLVCDKRLYSSHADTALMVGSLLGAIIFGKISDRFGRKVCFHSSLIVFIGFGIGMAWSSNFYIFAVTYAISGAASTGLFAASIVTAMEFVLPEHRKYPGLLINTFFPVGECILTGIAYALRNWRLITITLSAPAALMLSYYWFVPESIRWLMLHKRYHELDRVLRRIARINGKEAPVHDEEDEGFAELLQSYEQQDMEGEREQRKDSFFDLFRYCNLAQRVFITSLNWFIVNLCYFGLLYNSTDLRFSIFMNLFLGCILEAPSHIISVLLVDRVGRKSVHCFYLLLVAVTTAISIIASFKLEGVEWIFLVMTMIGKFAAAGLTGTSFLWMTELYPTSVRSTGVGVGSASARIGAILSYYIVQLSHNMESSLGNALPYIVFCGASVCGFIMCLGLPETSRRTLPSTIAEARLFGRNREEPDLNHGADVEQKRIAFVEPNLNYGANDGYTQLQNE